MQKHCITSFLLFLCLPLGLFAQRPINRIIIWDVTQSMIGVTLPNHPPEYGYRAEHDIFDIVKKGIADVVAQASEDNSGDIRIIQFRNIVLTNEVFPNSDEGRSHAKKYIEEYQLYKDKRSSGNTNICGAWEQAMQFLDPTKQNIVYLFTDGEQNIPNGSFGVQCLPHLIQTYCALTQSSDVFTFFITLDMENNALASMLKDACPKKLAPISVTQLKKNGIPPLINLRPMFDTLMLNIQEPQPMCTQRFEIIGPKLPEDFNIHANLRLLSHNLPLDIKFVIKKAEGMKCDIDFTLEDVSGTALKALREQLNENIVGELIVENATRSNSFITISPSSFPIILFNKKPQTLNFIVK